MTAGGRRRAAATDRLRARRRAAERPGPTLPFLAAGPFARPARAGFAVACPAYRLSGEAVHPAQTDDRPTPRHGCTLAPANWARTPRALFLWGESAGAHLAALTTLTHHTRPGTAATTGCATWHAPTGLPALAEDFPSSAYDPQGPAHLRGRDARRLGGSLAAARPPCRTPPGPPAP
ncbi:alpha/beta hydrolase fold domain-containing protein [Streptomyces sp. URMC 126]|uniref:alpha/beta hydrolase fold domain-containing protein n=1 Tax=Streptomyces sp. URMC 126 TaxID=3423401 RepID=UPI003F19CEF4